MSRLGEQNAPGFAAISEALQKAHETADVEIMTTSRTVYKIKRGQIEIGNGIITIPNKDQIMIIPFNAIEHLSYRKI